MTSFNLRIKEAIESTKELSKTGVIPPQYFENTLASRQPNGFGSRFAEAKSEKDLVEADWTEYQHPAVMAGCTAFRAPIPGVLGVVRLEDLPKDLPVVLDDEKETGQVSAEVNRDAISSEIGEVDYTVIILGEEGGREIVFTFHPGDPIRPSVIPAEGNVGKAMTVAEAIQLGFDYAKVRG